ncbi:MAG: hypothetical protein WC069_05915 [Candidatus Shapirobacteria bacterium]
MYTQPNKYTRFNTYSPSDYGPEEVAFQSKFHLQMNDARNYFLRVIKPRLDRSYKLYIAYNGDRQLQIKNWQSNIFVPYVQAVVETLMPRVLDARPDFSVQARNQADQFKTEKQQQLNEYLWELSQMDKIAEDVVRSSLVYGTGFLQAFWKKDVRTHKFLKSKDLLKKKYEWKEESRTFYDAPAAEWVDNYTLWYDWHNTERQNKQYWFKRLVLTAPEIKKKYPNADPDRLQLALNNPGGDLSDYASIRVQVKQNSDLTVKGVNSFNGPAYGFGSDKYNTFGDPDLQMYEVFEWTQPFADCYSVHVGGSWTPILKNGWMPIPYDFKEANFIDFPYLKVPGEFEGYGLPMILENPQIMMNMIKNQRLDAATLSIHKMWIVNPLANINKEELVTRPFGIIYSVDPNGVREVQFSDIKASAYKEEDLLKADMRYASGVDDFSMGAGGSAGSATEVRHLRESTLERVRLFINHLGNGFADLMRYWMDMERQFFTKDMTIRIIGDDGKELFPLIEKEDLCGKFDYKAKVLPSIAGQQDVKKKQDMDLFQLLINLPFVDPQKLTQKVIQDWDWSLDSIVKGEDAQAEQQLAVDGQADPNAQDPMAAMMGGADQQGAIPQTQDLGTGPAPATSNIPAGVAGNALAMLRGGAPQGAAVGGPIVPQSPRDLFLSGGGNVSTRVALPTTNTRGANRTGNVNTNTSAHSINSNPESQLMNRATSLQRKK